MDADVAATGLDIPAGKMLVRMDIHAHDGLIEHILRLWPEDDKWPVGQMSYSGFCGVGGHSYEIRLTRVM